MEDSTSYSQKATEISYYWFSEWGKSEKVKLQIFGLTHTQEDGTSWFAKQVG
jgi:hypothetical protein